MEDGIKATFAVVVMCLCLFALCILLMIFRTCQCIVKSLNSRCDDLETVKVQPEPDAGDEKPSELSREHYLTVLR